MLRRTESSSLTLVRCVGIKRAEVHLLETRMSDGKVLQFKPRPKKEEVREGTIDLSSLSGIIGNINENMGLGDIPEQQAMRIQLGLKGIKDYNFSATSIAKQSEIISSWSAEEILSEAKKSTVQDWKIKPSFYSAIVIALRSKK